MRLTLLIFSLIFSPLPAFAQEDMEFRESVVRSVSTGGVGSVTVVPDIVKLTLQVETESSRAEKAITENNEIAQRVIESLRGLGIAKQDIRTSNFSLRNYTPRSSSADEYRVTNSINVTIRDISLVSPVIIAVVEDGATSINYLHFDVSDPNIHYGEARRLAIQSSREAAKAFAEEADAEVGRALLITDNPFETLRDSVALQSASSSNDVPIEAGTKTISAEVRVAWELE